MRHLFLTGEKGVGKSTLLRKALAGYTGRVGGFLTVKTRAFLKDRDSVHLLLPGEEAAPTEENLLFVCGEEGGDAASRFDRLGGVALSRCAGCRLLLMDELGPREAEAPLFRAAVLTALAGDTPVLGVLQAPAARFWPEAARHPRVRLLEVTRGNRDAAETLRTIRAALDR